MGKRKKRARGAAVARPGESGASSNPIVLGEIREEDVDMAESSHRPQLALANQDGESGARPVDSGEIDDDDHTDEHLTQEQWESVGPFVMEHAARFLGGIEAQSEAFEVISALMGQVATAYRLLQTKQSPKPTATAVADPEPL